MGWQTGVGGAGGGAGGATEATLGQVRDWVSAHGILTGEEIRYDIPTVLISGDIYIGSATDGTLTSAASWKVTRIYFDANGNPSRKRQRTGVVWDNRTLGW